MESRLCSALLLGPFCVILPSLSFLVPMGGSAGFKFTPRIFFWLRSFGSQSTRCSPHVPHLVAALFQPGF